MLDTSPVQIVIVLAIVLLIVGPRRLPELGRGLGSGIRDFRSGLTGDTAVPRDTEPAGPMAGVPPDAHGPDGVAGG
ncbi:Sec-independent protein translocase subunit TatA/TatB [Miltoncostaea marina]|uniref:Sec-independent protein translocase subunit TatA/TatB n=1 Tax=Miltoncostaea marina TaxID=2843215 RepID=UPI001C3D1333|nr:twin-arginine translocase TatA/TatE family subunit [Miltoncostaea marina]